MQQVAHLRVKVALSSKAQQPDRWSYTDSEPRAQDLTTALPLDLEF